MFGSLGKAGGALVGLFRTSMWRNLAFALGLTTILTAVGFSLTYGTLNNVFGAIGAFVVPLAFIVDMIIYYMILSAADALYNWYKVAWMKKSYVGIIVLTSVLVLLFVIFRTALETLGFIG